MNAFKELIIKAENKALSTLTDFVDEVVEQFLFNNVFGNCEFYKNLQYDDCFESTIFIDYQKTSKNIKEWMLKQDDLIIRNFLTTTFIWGPDFMLNTTSLRYYSLKKQVDDRILKLIEYENNKNKFYYINACRNGFTKTSMDIKVLDIDLNLQYNDSLPHDKTIKFIKSDTSGLAIFHGIPGCGKSTYIRYLISNNPSINFYILDSSLFSYITNNEFIQFLLDNRNSVFILEDCEKLLVSRESNYNQSIATLLNITDGLLGDSLNLKFICTFNTNLDNIDSALLRKGRLKLKYEFDKLSIDKSKQLLNSLNKTFNVTEPMTLSDIYNIDEDNGYKIEKQKHKIGF